MYPITLNINFTGKHCTQTHLVIINSVSFPLFSKCTFNLSNITNYFYNESYLILSDIFVMDMFFCTGRWNRVLLYNMEQNKTKNGSSYSIGKCVKYRYVQIINKTKLFISFNKLSI